MSSDHDKVTLRGLARALNRQHSALGKLVRSGKLTALRGTRRGKSVLLFNVETARREILENVGPGQRFAGDSSPTRKKPVPARTSKPTTAPAPISGADPVVLAAVEELAAYVAEQPASQQIEAYAEITELLANSVVCATAETNGFQS